jgi:hypothetical protein
LVDWLEQLKIFHYDSATHNLTFHADPILNK